MKSAAAFQVKLEIAGRVIGDIQLGTDESLRCASVVVDFSRLVSVAEVKPVDSHRRIDHHRSEVDLHSGERKHVALIDIAETVCADLMSVLGMIESYVHDMIVAETCSRRPLPDVVADVEMAVVVAVAAGDNTFLFLVDFIPMLGIVELKGEI